MRRNPIKDPFCPDRRMGSTSGIHRSRSLVPPLGFDRSWPTKLPERQTPHRRCGSQGPFRATSAGLHRRLSILLPRRRTSLRARVRLRPSHKDLAQQPRRQGRTKAAHRVASPACRGAGQLRRLLQAQHVLHRAAQRPPRIAPVLLRLHSTTPRAEVRQGHADARHAGRPGDEALNLPEDLRGCCGDTSSCLRSVRRKTVPGRRHRPQTGGPAKADDGSTAKAPQRQ